MKFPRLPLISKIVLTKHIFLLIIPVSIVLFLSMSGVLFHKDQDQLQETAGDFKVYQDFLKSQVENETGDPKSGRDPASQQQGSLVLASSSPTSAPRQSKTANVNEDPSQTGLNVSGCYFDYGDPGQCVPAHAATNGTLTCEGLRTHGGFPSGVKVSGNDRFHLDTNQDRIACGNGD